MIDRYEISMTVGPCSEEDVERIMVELVELYGPQVYAAVGSRVIRDDAPASSPASSSNAEGS